jgi:hypothetical protein
MIAGLERRLNPRMPSSQSARLRLRFEVPGGAWQVESTQVEEVNATTCRLNLNLPLDAHTRVLIIGDVTPEGAELQLRGHVTWCRQLSKWHWTLGIEFSANLLPEGQPAPQSIPAYRGSRQSILSLLAHKPVISLLEFGDLFGVSRERIEFTLWLLKESGFVTRTIGDKFSITPKGALELEAQLSIPEQQRRQNPSIPAPLNCGSVQAETTSA